ncbi:ensconsin isoform 2-T2 [Anomaloglossus baeobatrachus]|uniref:ensconsin isoform X2 n=1 Tax=Anomaloglossus baeobatrachus TaxID=238106 RepID=UPI003F4FB321
MLIFLKSKKKKTVAGNMPGSATATRQDRAKKTGTRPTAPVLFTINEEDEQQRNGNSKKEKAPDGPHGKEKKMSLSQARRDNALSKSEPHLTLKVDERQRLARERREEREKLMAARESLWLEKEVRAQQHYAKHLEERKKKLEEQRIKEERRRAAVDEKRRQKLEEEKERHEAVVKRTMERSQKPKQKNNRWSWGGTLQSSTSISSSDPDRRSVSTMNLSKHVDPVINKRLSTSSATLLNTPDRGRRPQLSPWESNVVSRLLTPTHSYLARSKSTAALSGDAVIPICPRSASCSPITPQPSKTQISKSFEKAKHFFSTPEAIARRKTTHFAGLSSVEKKEKRETDRENVLLAPIPILKRAISPNVPKPKSPAPTSGSSHKSSPRPVPAIVNSVIKVATTPQRPPSPGNVRPVKKDSKEDSKKKLGDIPPNPTEKERIEEKDTPAANAVGSGEEKPRTPSPTTAEPIQEPPSLPPTPILASPTVTNKPFAGTNDPGEATRILAEKRRLAREQRERDEEEKREKEEEQRRKKEEIAQRQAIERARREEEAKQQELERKEKEEKESQEKERLEKQQAEEKEQRDREEAERLLKQKEESDRIKLEREKHFQKEEQERSERKKRLEEIMKRTRRSEAGDKPSLQKNGEVPKPVENEAITPTPLQEEETSVFLQNNSETPRNGESVAPSPKIVTFSPALPLDSTDKQPNENGLRTPNNNNFEEIINLPVGSKPMKLDSLNNEGNSIQDLPPLNPLIAFEVDNVQTPQTAEVI